VRRHAGLIEICFVADRFDIFHVVDHSYAQLVHELPGNRTVVTCHDIDTFRSIIEPGREPRHAAFRAMTRRILGGLRKAGHVVCDTEATREALIQKAGFTEQKTSVVHKHGVGSCEGTLTATLDGLRYESSNKSDAFSLPYPQVETFVVDYLEKNLRVKQKGGKTWNFTNKDANADALFVFHRDVESARKKLADGYAPAK